MSSADDIRGLVSRQRGWPAGFSMLELALGMAVLAVVAGAVTPVALRYVRQEAAHKVAREIMAILDAGKTFYVANLRWPASLDELRSSGGLPAGFGQSPFGTAYGAMTAGSQLQVSVDVPSDTASTVARVLPVVTAVPAGEHITLTTSSSAPGTAVDLSMVLHRQGTLVASTLLGPLEIADQSSRATMNIRSLGATSTNLFEGKVGIGTTTPRSSLDVAGAITAEAVWGAFSGIGSSWLNCNGSSVGFGWSMGDGTPSAFELTPSNQVRIKMPGVYLVSVRGSVRGSTYWDHAWTSLLQNGIAVAGAYTPAVTNNAYQINETTSVVRFNAGDLLYGSTGYCGDFRPGDQSIFLYRMN